MPAAKGNEYYKNREKIGRPRAIESPEKLIELFELYKTNVSNTENEMSISSFEDFTRNNFSISLSAYITNRELRYTEFVDSIKNIKSEIFNHKINLYKSGKLHHQKISRDLYDRGLNFDDINKEKFILKTISNEYPFEVCKKGITIKDVYLKKMPVQSKNMVHKTIPNELYVINMKGTNIYKIGISCNSQQRIYNLRAANPFPIDVIHLHKCLFPKELEIKIHNYLHDKHIKNEWFKIDDIDNLLNIIKLG